MAYSPESIIIVSSILPAIAIIAVILRFYVRLKVKPQHIGIDDYLAITGVLLAVVDSALLIAGVVFGTQGHVYEGELPPEQAGVQGILDYVTLIIEKPLYGAMKLSVLFFFRRIFYHQTNFKALNDTLIVGISLWTVTYVLVYIFSCGLNFSLWFAPNAARTPPNCVNVNALNFSFAITDVVGDLLVMVTPYYYLRKVQMERSSKIGVTAIFLLGTLSTVAAIIRIGFIATAFEEDFGAGGNNHGTGIAPAVWSMAEGNVGMIAACLPPLGPLIKKVPFPSQLGASIKDMINSSGRKGSTGEFDIKHDLQPYTPPSPPAESGGQASLNVPRTPPVRPKVSAESFV